MENKPVPEVTHMVPLKQENKDEDKSQSSHGDQEEEEE
jgi:hypothetical protein